MDISSRWGGDIVWPDYLSQYAATGAHVMDMEPYYGPGDPNANQFGKPEPRNMSQMQQILDGLTAKIPLPQIGVAVGTVELPGHANASCGPGFSACTNYGWNRTTLREFIKRVEAAGITELDVWREDLTPPKGETVAIPEWFVEEVAAFLARADQDRAQREIAALNPGYGGRASPRRRSAKKHHGPP